MRTGKQIAFFIVDIEKLFGGTPVDIVTGSMITVGLCSLKYGPSATLKGALGQ